MFGLCSRDGLLFFKQAIESRCVHAMTGCTSVCRHRVNWSTRQWRDMHLSQCGALGNHLQTMIFQLEFTAFSSPWPHWRKPCSVA